VKVNSEYPFFTEDEDAYLVDAFKKRIKVSRMAIKLDRSYNCLEYRLVQLGFVHIDDFERRKNSKYSTPDEIEFELLLDGNTEEDIKKEIGLNKVYASSGGSSGNEDD